MPRRSRADEALNLPAVEGGPWVYGQRWRGRLFHIVLFARLPEGHPVVDENNHLRPPARYGPPAYCGMRPLPSWRLRSGLLAGERVCQRCEQRYLRQRGPGAPRCTC
jgi:hypothetical protein